MNNTVTILIGALFMVLGVAQFLLPAAFIRPRNESSFLDTFFPMQAYLSASPWVRRISGAFLFVFGMALIEIALSK